METADSIPEEEVEELRRENADLSSRLTEVRYMLAEQETALAATRAESAEPQPLRTNAELSQEALRARADASEARFSLELEREKSHRDQQVVEGNTQMLAVQSSNHEALIREVGNNHAIRIDEMENRHAAHVQELESHRDFLIDELKASHLETVGSMEARLEESEKRVSSMEARVEELNKHIKDIDADRDRLASDRRGLKAQVEAIPLLREELSRSQNQVKSITSEAKSKVSEIADLVAEASNSRGGLKNLKQIAAVGSQKLADSWLDTIRNAGK